MIMGGIFFHFVHIRINWIQVHVRNIIVSIVRTMRKARYTTSCIARGTVYVPRYHHVQAQPLMSIDLYSFS